LRTEERNGTGRLREDGKMRRWDRYLSMWSLSEVEGRTDGMNNEKEAESRGHGAKGKEHRERKTERRKGKSE